MSLKNIFIIALMAMNLVLFGSYISKTMQLEKITLQQSQSPLNHDPLFSDSRELDTNIDLQTEIKITANNDKGLDHSSLSVSNSDSLVSINDAGSLPAPADLESSDDVTILEAALLEQQLIEEEIAYLDKTLALEEESNLYETPILPGYELSLEEQQMEEEKLNEFLESDNNYSEEDALKDEELVTLSEEFPVQQTLGDDESE